MREQDKYVTLMTALPFLGDLFKSKQTPCSRYKLDEYLQMLEPQDAQLLHELEDLMQWSHQPIERSDEHIVRHARRCLQSLDNEFIKEVVLFRLELRTAVAALRRRKLHSDPPPPGKAWGAGRWVSFIENHWDEPAFGLDNIFPWLAQANRLLRADDNVGLERLLLKEVWEGLRRLGEGHYFDFEAVVIYVFRWNVINRWTTYSEEGAAIRYSQMIDTGLGQYRHMFH
jgi:hypothetical protein